MLIIAVVFLRSQDKEPNTEVAKQEGKHYCCMFTYFGCKLTTHTACVCTVPSVTQQQQQHQASDGIQHANMFTVYPIICGCAAIFLSNVTTYPTVTAYRTLISWNTSSDSSIHTSVCMH